MKRERLSGAPLDRRALIIGTAAIATAPWLRRGARAQTHQAAPTFQPETHGLSSFGELAYGPDFRHFAYVDPTAPKGGAISMQNTAAIGNQAFDTFNTLNIYVLKGDGAAGMALTFASLMAPALDEPSALYGFAASGVARSDDGLAYRFTMRPEARFHDGSKLTAKDAAFSLLLLKTKGHPTIAQSLGQLEGADAPDEATLILRFAKGRSRDLPLLVASLPIFSQAFYSANNFEDATLTPPLGSGPYKVARFEQGRFIEFERVEDYWGRELPVNMGQHNFDTLRYEYFRDRQVAFEAFKAATFTFREEFTSRDWSTGYEFPAVKDGRVQREVLPDETPSGTQGWFFNTRRETFKDPRVREAIGLLFDFEWTNVNIMFGQYKRTTSYFENSTMKAIGPPGEAELALLAPWRGKVPDEVFGEPFLPPVSDGSGQDRALMRRADQLLREAGCKRDGTALKLPNGQALAIEFLDFSPALQPHTQAFIKTLKLLGIDARSRIVDAAQYQRRVDEFDFDMITQRAAMGLTPGEGLKVMFGSQAAGIVGSSNIIGVADPAVDALIEAALTAATREDLVAACRALDRVLRAGRYWVPMWNKASHWIAYWDLYSRPAIKPRYDRGVPATWWYDKAKAKRIGKAE
jgi:microcin C transport system substrate-binding protein